jgi:hypothetical protein
MNTTTIAMPARNAQIITPTPEGPAIPTFVRQSLSIPLGSTFPRNDSIGQETADAYGRVLFLAQGGRLRIITCKEGIQWIVQTRRPLTSKAQRPWIAAGFCTTTKGLCRVLRAHLNAGFPSLEEFLETLPDNFPRKQ